MTYPPPPGQPGADGWPGGDPNQPPPGGAGWPDGNQLPPPDPYAQPGYPQQDPYAAPASGVPGPYSAPPAYGPPGGPGMPPPGGMMPMGPPPKSSNGAGWIIGGIVGAVVILGVVVTVLIATGVFGSKDDGGDSASGSSDSSDSSSSADSGGAKYKFASQFCDDVDLTDVKSGGFEESSAPSNITTPGSDANSGMMSCIVSLADSNYDSISLTVNADTFADKDSAVSDYKSMMSTASTTPDKNVSGKWEQGMSAGAPGTSTLTYGLYIQDGNLAMSVSIYGYEVGWGDKADSVAKDLLENTMGKLAN